MGTDGRLVGAVFGLIGVAVGAGLNHFLAAERQEQSKLLDLRSSAYVLFLRGQAALQESREVQGNPNKVLELEQQYRDAVKQARLQIGVLGSGDLVTALTEYFLLKPPSRDCDRTWSVDVEIYKAMRRDLLPTKEEATVDDARLYYILWNCLPPSLAKRVSTPRE